MSVNFTTNYGGKHNEISKRIELLWSCSVKKRLILAPDSHEY